MKRNELKIIDVKQLMSIKGGRFDTGSCPPPSDDLDFGGGNKKGSGNFNGTSNGVGRRR